VRPRKQYGWAVRWLALAPLLCYNAATGDDATNQEADVPTITLSTGSLYTYGIARVFALAAETGFEAIEILVDHRWDSRQPGYLRQLAQQVDLPIVAVHNPFLPNVPGWAQDELGRLEKTVALARALGAGVVVTHLPLRVTGMRVEFFGAKAGPVLLPVFLRTNHAYRNLLLKGLPAFEAAEGITVGVENMPATRLLGRMWNIYALNDLDMLDAMPHLTLDTTHLGTWGLDPVAVYERLRARVVHVHLSDFDGREHRLPGSGHLPLGRFLSRLSQDGYQGAVSLEVGPEVLEAEDEKQVRAHLRHAVSFCREHTAGG
jgi:sugar phosphate isomerase/epimerase